MSLIAASGRIDHVWNSLCSDRHAIIVPSSCSASDSAIWSRSGAAVDPATGDLVVATGNAPFDGSTNWGDSVLVLSPDAGKLLRHWTPADQAHLNSSDLDLGSTSPALLPGRLRRPGWQGRLAPAAAAHQLPGANARTGGELQTLRTPGNAMLFSEPAVWQGKWVFVSDDSGTEALVFSGGRLKPAWSNGTGRHVARRGGRAARTSRAPATLAVYAPTSGNLLASLPSGDVHWQSPIVVDGRVVVAEGNANSHSTSGVLDIYTLP